MKTAKFIGEITVIDPDSKGEVELSIFKHSGGGIFAIDSSYIEQVLPMDNSPIVPDVFEDFLDDVAYNTNDGVKLIDI